MAQDPGRQRTAAWAQLVREATVPVKLDEIQAALERRQQLRARLREAGAHCDRGRAQLNQLADLASRHERLKLAEMTVREWVRVVDEVLRLAERTCQVAATERAKAA